jgi:hypothetical protein
MASGRFSKQAAPYLGQGHFLNSNNSGDTVIGGTVTAAPAGIGASQFQQNLPGDRFIFSPVDALALSNNSVGNLYTGTYRYVATRNNSTSIPQRGRAAFWDIAAGGYNNSTPQADALYQVTSDESALVGVTLMAGVYINYVSQGSYWFIQESGKATCQFAGNNGTVTFGTGLTGTPAAGCGVYLAAQSSSNANNTVGLFNVLAGANYASANNNAATVPYNAIDQALTRYVGPAETLPSAGNFSVVDIGAFRSAFRW